MNNFNNYLVEFLGTMFFIFIILYIGEPVTIGVALIIAILKFIKIVAPYFHLFAVLIIRFSSSNF